MRLFHRSVSGLRRGACVLRTVHPWAKAKAIYQRTVSRYTPTQTLYSDTDTPCVITHSSLHYHLTRSANKGLLQFRVCVTTVKSGASWMCYECDHIACVFTFQLISDLSKRKESFGGWARMKVQCLRRILGMSHSVIEVQTVSRFSRSILANDFFSASESFTNGTRFHVSLPRYILSL